MSNIITVHVLRPHHLFLRTVLNIHFPIPDIFYQRKDDKLKWIYNLQENTSWRQIKFDFFVVNTVGLKSISIFLNQGIINYLKVFSRPFK